MNHVEAADQVGAALVSTERFLVAHLPPTSRRNRYGHLPVMSRTRLRVVNRETEEAFIVTVEEE